MTVERVGVTGTSRGMLPQQWWGLRKVLEALRAKGAVELHHGDCVEADEKAHEIGLELGYRIVIHPPDKDGERAFCQGYAEMREPLPYLVRDENIAVETQVLVACPFGANERTRSGTWATVRRARKHSRPILIVDPLTGQISRDKG